MTEGALTPEDVPAYIASRVTLRDLVDPGTLTVSEVGDGNLNLIFICVDGGGRSLVLKQALPYVRLVGPEWPMTEARAAREAAAIRVHGALSPHVCRLIDFDADRHCLALEDLSDHQVFRTRLNEGGPYAGVAERIGELVADIAFGSSFLALTEEEFRNRAAAAANPELCAITEALVCTEPFLGADRNSVRPSLEQPLAGLQADPAWIAAAMEMKRSFLTAQETLLHGDLHSGSVFVRGDGDDLSVKAFDSEFACYGPVGVDLGMMWANMAFAACRAGALGDLGSHMLDLTRFLVGEIREVICDAGVITKRRKRLDSDEYGEVDVDDYCHYMAKIDNNVHGVFQITRMAFGRGNYQRIEIYGSQGGLIYELDGEERLYVGDGPVGNKADYRQVDIPDDCRSDQMESFYELVTGQGDGLSATINDGYINQLTIDALLQSSEERRWVELPQLI